VTELTETVADEEADEAPEDSEWSFHGSEPRNREMVRARVKERAEENAVNIRDLFPAVSLEDGTLTIQNRRRFE
jgi:hypothetical protein